MSAEKLSIIIPVYRDAEALASLLADLEKQTLKNFEILVCGVEGDRKLKALPATSLNCKFIQAPKASRALQMNMAAKEASGAILFFLHADSRFSNPNFINKNLEVFKKAWQLEPTVVGHCPLEFKTHAPKGLNYFFYEEKTQLSRPLTINGDQGLMIGKETFYTFGAFNSRFAFLEDQFFSATVFQKGRWQLLPEKITTSARRFEEEGLFKRMFLNAVIMDVFLLEWWSYLEEARGIYSAPKAKKNILLLTPYISLIVRLLWREKNSWDKLYRGSQFVKDQLWQVFFYFDVRRRFKDRSYQENICLSFYDKNIAPILQGKFWELLAVIFTLKSLALVYLVLCIPEWMLRKESEF